MLGLFGQHAAERRAGGNHREDVVLLDDLRDDHTDVSNAHKRRIDDLGQGHRHLKGRVEDVAGELVSFAVT